MHVFNDSHAPLPLRQHAARLRTGERRVLKGCWRVGGSERNASPPVRIVILRLKTGERLIIASLVQLLERYGASQLDAAITEALERDVPHPKPDEPEPKKRRSPSAVRANLDDPPIHIRPIVPASAGAKEKNHVGSGH
jgi:hypothetical protein